MPNYICLILDEHCQVMLAVIERGELDDVIRKIGALNDEREAWGFEIWADGARVHESYDCATPPGRAHIHT